MAWQPVILEYLNQCLRLTTFGEKHRTTLVDIYFHLMTLNMEFSEVTIFLFIFLCLWHSDNDNYDDDSDDSTRAALDFFSRKSSHLENFQ